MNNSDYLKMNMESERKIALSLEEGLTSFRKNGHEVLNSIYSGAERVSWYTSCFFDNYQDVCQELKEEDKRMIAAMNEVFTRKDVIFDMVELYTGHVLDNFSDSAKERIVIQVTGFLAKNRTKFSTKSALSYLIAKSISESMNFTTKIRTAIGKVSNIILTLLDFYSNIQKAALSARRLKTLNSVFYYILYRNNLEMLCFIIEPVLQRNIGIMNTTLSERDVIAILRDITK